MKNITTYAIILATFGSVACSQTEELDTPQGRGNELVVRTELVSESDWATTRSEEPAVYSAVSETTDGEYIITATREEWTGAADTIAADTPVTRGTPIGSAAGIANMRVNLFRTGNANWTTSSSLTKSINATNVNGGFTTSPNYNWASDPSAKTTLFAYSPIPSGSNGIEERLPNSIYYSVPTDVAQQPDLCTAVPHMNVINDDGVQQTRTFALKHQLTAVGFNMLGWRLKITHITVSGVYTKVTMTMKEDGAITMQYGAGLIDCNVGVTDHNYEHTIKDNYANITRSDGYLMMIPQGLSREAKVTIYYSSTGDGSSPGRIIANLADIAGIGQWNEGEKITYNIRLKTAPAVTSNDLTMDSRKYYTTSSPLSFVMDNKDNLTFKWSADWLRIHRGNPLKGTSTEGGVSDWSTGTGGSWNNIYFFATSDNPSSSYERTAVVTVEGTRSGTRTFNVRQAKAPSFPAGSYIPKDKLVDGGWTNFPGSTGLQVAMIGNVAPGGTSAASDQKMQWSTAKVNKGTATGYGTGKSNYSRLAGSGYPISTVCWHLGSGWYVPSKDELMLIYNNHSLLGSSYRFDKNYYYWSSSEYNSNISWVVNFDSGTTYIPNKTYNTPVRCVREI